MVKWSLLGGNIVYVSMCECVVVVTGFAIEREKSSHEWVEFMEQNAKLQKMFPDR